MIPIKYVLLEGVDLAGKSTLYRNLHKETGFKYNIQDRSALSMLCYAILYGRDETEHRCNLLAELCDGNNFFVVLMPHLDVVLKRYADRGDDFQDEESLVKLYHIFNEEISKIISLPNVYVVRHEVEPLRLSVGVAKALESYSQQSPGIFGEIISNWCDLSPRKEVQFHVSFDVPVSHDDKEILKDPTEGEYFGDIMDDVHYIIDREIEGDNPYNAPQDVDSRRFYFHSDTCISSIHFLPRDGHLKVLCTLRSTNSIHNGPLDLRFLAHLAAEVGSFYDEWKIDKITLDVKFNSLHIRK